MMLNNYLKKNDLFPPEIPVKSAMGKYGLMWSRGLVFIHDTAPLLDSYSCTGCPTDYWPSWTKENILMAIRRGAHPTAKKQRLAIISSTRQWKKRY